MIMKQFKSVIFVSSCPTVILPTACGPNIITNFFVLILSKRYLSDNNTVASTCGETVVLMFHTSIFLGRVYVMNTKKISIKFS